ncbi:Cytochrome c1 heme lyase [Coemansia spiralis]|uniref:Holocytochrome c-type synthase n=2 Tax=Coemansia TaxID=4863 RepID=A0A9W8L0I9_9FUNG|nr:Cytochrome c1 heme lyase [Coemansia umbellata]KAJ2623213.1 Cytochrome c1 heme lyase [Coemansia sp. RSA 1358]KAJ2680091.1 Cytochrome c1 heme lyase [Coemansia spiralis]
MSSDSTSTPAAKCPIDHSSLAKDKTMKAAAATVSSTGETANSAPLACPVDHAKSLTTLACKEPQLDPRNQMPVVPEQQATSGQDDTLSTARTISTIPRADRYQSAGESLCPALHEDNAGPSTQEDKDMWIYPSEQMFFNAMKRKNWRPEERDMKTVVPIHNAVNEMCWTHILEWEKMHKSTCSGPKLLKFEGKANQMTPRAWFRSLIGYQKPFDRHDWTVDRCGKSIRYVIDFYQGKKDPQNPHAPSFYLDVRPALTLESSWDRLRKFAGY